MEGLLKTTQAYRLIEMECARDTCSHAYLLLCDDGKNLKQILKIFAKIWEGHLSLKTLSKKQKNMVLK